LLPLDDHLDRAQQPAMRTIRVGRNADASHGRLHGGGDLVHQRVMDEATRDVDDPVGSLLEDADLR